MRTEWAMKWAAKRQNQKTAPSLLKNVREDNKMNNFELETSSVFNGVTCDFYHTDGDYTNLWMTRNQIGEALEYKNPNDAIRLIHNRYPHRLNDLSTSFKLKSTDGKMYDTIVYNQRGIMEICRLSKQPKADEFMDWVLDLAEVYCEGSLKPDKSLSSASVPLNREELAAYMMYNSQIIESYKASTDAILKTIQEKDAALLTQQLNCLNAMTDMFKEFAESESGKTQKFGAMVASAMYALKGATETINNTISLHSPSSAPEHNASSVLAWKTRVFDDATAVGKYLGKSQMQILMGIYNRMRKEGCDLDAAQKEYREKYNATRQDSGLINVIANNDVLRATFEHLMNQLLENTVSKKDDGTPQTISVSQETSNPPEYLLLPLDIRVQAERLIPEYGKNLSQIMCYLYKNFEAECGISLKDFMRDYTSRTGRKHFNKGYMILQYPELSDKFMDFVRRMGGAA